jgi:branched-chain amino acid transport system permease protein
MSLQLTISGLAMGAIYALIALGFTLIWNAVGIVNFAQGELVMIAAYVSAGWLAMPLHFPWILNLFIVMLFMAIFGMFIARWMYHPLRKASQLSAIVATIGLSLFLKNTAVLIWGPEPLVDPSPFKAITLHIGRAAFSGQYVSILVALLILMGLQVFMFRRTQVGRAMQATAQDREVARLMGVNTTRIISIIFAYAFVLAGIAGVLMAPLFYVSADMGSLVALKAFAACIIGGFGNVQGAVAGGLILGILEAFGSYFISSQYVDVISFGLLIAFLIFRPQGIFGEPIMERP